MTEPEQSIVFVIGAGASKEVNMPTGYELKAKIAKALSFEVDTYRRLAGGDSTVRESMHQLAQRPDASGDVNAYLKSALLIKGAMPQAPSIDNFIDSHRADPKIAQCGKLAIASEILKAERQSKLFIDPSNIHNKLEFSRVEDTWLHAFFQLLNQHTQLDEIAERLRRVKIISFNYDRTLEHFLHHAIKNYYGCSSEVAAEALGSLVILHPYGRVGGLPWQKSTKIAVPYGGELESSALCEVASTLRTFTEGTNDKESQITKIRDVIYSASTLIFLGFAYHELNLELLFGKGQDGPKRYQKQVYGTAIGLSESNKRAIASELADLGKYDVDQITLRSQLSAAQLIPEYSRTIKF